MGYQVVEVGKLFVAYFAYSVRDVYFDFYVGARDATERSVCKRASAVCPRVFPQHIIIRDVLATVKAKIFLPPFKRYHGGVVEYYLQISPLAIIGAFHVFQPNFI